MNCPMCGHSGFELAETCLACGERSISFRQKSPLAYRSLCKGLSWACFAGGMLLWSMACEFLEVAPMWNWAAFGLGFCGMEIAKIICCFENVPAKSWVQRSLTADVSGLLLLAACAIGATQQEIAWAIPFLLLLVGQLLFIGYLLSIAALIRRIDLAKRACLLMIVAFFVAGLFIHDQVTRCYPWQPANTFEVYSPTIYGSLFLIFGWLLLQCLSQLRAAVRSVVLKVSL